MPLFIMIFLIQYIFDLFIIKYLSFQLIELHTFLLIINEMVDYSLHFLRLTENINLRPNSQAISETLTLALTLTLTQTIKIFQAIFEI